MSESKREREHEDLLVTSLKAIVGSILYFFVLICCKILFLAYQFMKLLSGLSLFFSNFVLFELLQMAVGFLIFRWSE